MKNIVEWAEEHGYEPLYGGEDRESLHIHKQGSPILDSWYWWRFVKLASGPKGYFRYRLNVDFHLLGEGKTEVMHKGKKVKLDKGEIEFMILPVLELDWRNEWQKDGVLGLAHRVFRKNIYKKEIDGVKDDVYLDAVKLQGMLKEYMKVPTFTKEEAASMPPQGLLE